MTSISWFLMTLALLAFGWKDHAIFCSFALAIVIIFKSDLYMEETRMHYPNNYIGLFASLVNIMFLTIFLPFAILGETLKKAK